MKSRRELLSSFLIDVAKAIFIAIVLGKLTNPQLVSWFLVMISFVATIACIALAVSVHPEAIVDKEFFR